MDPTTKGNQAMEETSGTIQNALNSTTTTTILKIPIANTVVNGVPLAPFSTIADIEVNNQTDGEVLSRDLRSTEEVGQDENVKASVSNEQITVDDQNTTTISIVPAPLAGPVQNESSTDPAAGANAITLDTEEEERLSQNKTARQLFKEKAAEHGGDDSNIFLQQELNLALKEAQSQAQSNQRTRTTSNNLDVTVSRNPSTAGKHEKKIGHRRVDDEGEVTYKKIQSKQIMGSIQLGIQQTVGSLASKPKRDLLMNDFWEMETISFPSEGSSITPAHHYSDFRFKVYAPIAFRYFRDLFGIAPEDFLMSMCSAPLTQLSNPGASGSLFYLTNDDEFIIKTVQKKECEFLQKLLPGYYMNLSQNPRTLLPKFFGLFCFHYNAKNVRLVAMNNLLPSDIKMHAKYDLKGSTFRRKASKAERQKASPTFKDLDFMEHHPSGIFLETDKYNALMKTIQRDCMVLESFQIMDYSLLVGIHNLDLAAKEKKEERIKNARAKLQRHEEVRETSEENPLLESNDQISSALHGAFVEKGAGGNQPTTSAAGSALNRTKSINRQRLVAHSTAMESITANMTQPLEEDEDVPAGGIPARSENDERLILYIGIIDILQSYRLEKKLEHTFKSIIYNGDTVSVCRPSFYAQRFQNFMGKTVFKKTPTFPLKHSPSKRKTSTLSIRTPQRSTPSQSLSSNPASNRTIHHLSGMSTPPPAFEDIDEEDITATTSSSGMEKNNPLAQRFLSSGFRSRSRVSSNRSAFSSGTDDYSDDDITASGSAAISPRNSNRLDQQVAPRSPKLSKTQVQVTTIGCSEEELEEIPADEPYDSGNEMSSSTEVKKQYNSFNRQGSISKTETKKLFQSIIIQEPGEVHPTADSNGKPSAHSKTTVINTKAQTYTSTLVVNDVRR